MRARSICEDQSESYISTGLWVAAAGGPCSLQVPMFLNGKKVQSETWRECWKRACSRIGEYQNKKQNWLKHVEAQKVWGSEFQEVEFLINTNVTLPMYQENSGKSSAAEHPWITKESSTFYDVHNPATGVSAPWMSPFSSLDFEHFEASCSRYQANWLPGRRSVRQGSDPVTRSPASLGWWWNDGETMVKWWWNDGEMIRHCLVNIFFADVCSSDLLCILSFGRDLLPRLATAADSCAEAFKSWRSTPVSSRARVMFLQLQIQLGEGKESNKEPKGFIGKVSLELSERGLLQKCK